MILHMMELKPQILKALSTFTARKGQRWDTKFILLESSKLKSHVLFIISYYLAFRNFILLCES